MKRRDLIKNGLLVAGAVTVGAIGNQKLHQEKNSSSNEEKMTITPKQTAVYNISTALPFRFDLIDEYAELNSQLKKSQIRTFYNNIPQPLSDEFEEQFQQNRGTNDSIKSFDDFAQYVKYAQNLGFRFVYVLNSPKPFSSGDFYKHEKSFYTLLDNLAKIGCKEIKIANQQLMEIISQKRPEFILSASTSFEYHNVSQYKNLLSTYPAIKSVNIAIDDNRNFVYLKNLRKLFPNLDIEIMLNERCIHGCPARISHSASVFSYWQCQNKIYDKINKVKALCISNMIYPWQLEYYSAIGINSFKFFSPERRSKISNISEQANYLKCVEYGPENLKASDFFNKMFFEMRGVTPNIKNDIPLSELMAYLPDIEHFVKNGHKCSNICGIECNYCLKCVENTEKVLGIT